MVNAILTTNVLECEVIGGRIDGAVMHLIVSPTDTLISMPMDICIEREDGSVNSDGMCELAGLCCLMGIDVPPELEGLFFRPFVAVVECRDGKHDIVGTVNVLARAA